MKSERRFYYLTVIICSLIMFFSTGRTSSAYVLQGEGTEESPYLVSTAYEFYYLGTTQSAYYKLINDIDFNYQTLVPIERFVGILDGNNHTICNLNIYVPFNPNDYNWTVALFRNFENATVKNLTLENITVAGNIMEAGFLVAYAENSTLSNITVKNCTMHRRNASLVGAFGACGKNITATNCHIINNDLCGWSVVGGFFGELYNSTLINCTSTNTPIINGYETIGGIVGRTSNVQLLQCHSNSEVNGDMIVGGLVGITWGSLSLSECSVNAPVTANVQEAGGLLGINLSEQDEHVIIRDSYFVGPLIGNTVAGGLVADKIDSIQNSYAAGSIFAENRYGLAVSSHVENSYYDKQLNNINGIHGKTTNEMYQKSNYINWDFDNIWTIEDGIAYPTLKLQSNPEIHTQ